MKNSLLLIAGIASTGLATWAADPDLSKLPPVSTAKNLTYAKDIKPLFEASCFRCHGADRQRGGLRLDSLEAVMKGSEDGKILTVGDSKKSKLVVAVAQIDDESAMPPKGRPGGGRGGPGGPGGRGGFGPGIMLSRQVISQGDKNDDKKVSKAEFTALADAWFDKLDADKTGKLTQEQFTGKFADVLPAPQGGPGGGGGGRGGFNPAGFVAPGLFTATDANKDGSLTKTEFKDTFAKWYGEWDKTKSDALAEEQIREGLNAALPRPNFGGGPGGPGAQAAGGPGGAPGAGPGGPGGPGGQGGPGGGGNMPAPKPLTPEQVGLVRAWIDQGAK